MTKEIRFSNHANLKLDLLADRGIPISPNFVLEVIQQPDCLEIGEGDKLTAQKRLDEGLVLRVVYREFAEFIVVITLYPGRRSRYEKDSL